MSENMTFPLQFRVRKKIEIFAIKKVCGHMHQNYRYLPIPMTNTSQIIQDQANFDMKYSMVMLLHVQLIPDE